jgi:predicted ATPase
MTLGTLPPAISIDDKRQLRYASSYLTHEGEPALQIWDVKDGEFLLVRYSDGVEFWLEGGLGRLWAKWPASSSLENALSYLVGPVMGLLLRLRGAVCLHASAVSIAERAIVFMGSEGAGKSTTAAAFAQQGFPVLCDDIVALLEREQQFHALPAYRRINLWPDSVKLLYGSTEALPQITTEWEKRCLKLGEDGKTQFEERALPIAVIYILGDSKANSARSVERISQKTAMMTLVTNAYATNILDAKQRAEEFAVLSRLAAAVPVRQINARRDTVGPHELCRIIRTDFASITTHESSFER